jgi:hypothetical protein
LRDLDKVAAGVVEDGCGNRAHGDGRSRELDAGRLQPPVLGMDIVDGEGGEGDAVLDESALEGAGGRVRVGSSRSSGPSGSSGETTVSHRASPSGISVFFMKPSFWA